MKYVRPLFRELLRSSLGRGAAVELLRTHGSAYHPICLKASARSQEMLASELSTFLPHSCRPSRVTSQRSALVLRSFQQSCSLLDGLRRKRPASSRVSLTQY